MPLFHFSVVFVMLTFYKLLVFAAALLKALFTMNEISLLYYMV